MPRESPTLGGEPTRSPLSRFEWGCVAVVAAAFIVRLTFLLQPTFIWDTAWYLMNSRAFLETGSFLIRWSEPGAPQYSGYWPPLFPIFAAPFIKIFGPSYESLVAASIGAAALLVTAVFAATRDMYGRRAAFAAAALVAATPAYYSSDARGMSESLLALMVVMTVWLFVKSLDKPKWLPLAGIFAFLAYLGKASLGIPFVAAGFAALAAWRIYTRGWRRVIRSPMDVGVAIAGVIVMAIVALTRSERIGGLGLGLIEPLSRGVFQAHCNQVLPIESVGPHCWALVFPIKILFVIAFLIVITLPLSVKLREAIKAPRTERTDALWLAVTLPLVAGAVFTTTFFFTERRPIVDFDNIRYLTPAVVPFFWLLLPHTSFVEEPHESARTVEDRLKRRHETFYWLAVGTFVFLLFFNPNSAPQTFGRLQAFLLLSLVPLAFALLARRSRYDAVERRTPAGIERRYVPATGAGSGASPQFWAGGALLALAGWFYSAWYIYVGVGVLVAFATTSPTRRVVALGLILLASAAPDIYTAFPAQPAADTLADLPEGTIVGMSEIVVYPAAVAPDNVEVRLVSPDDGIPNEIDALLLQEPYMDGEFENFTRVRTWDYDFTFTPTVAARLWIEENVFGEVIEYRNEPGIALYVRDGRGLEGAALG